MHARPALSALLLGAGCATATTAFVSYLTRYSMFDALFGEIDPVLYRRITSMTGFEQSAVVVGSILFVAGCLLGAASLLLDRRDARSVAAPDRRPTLFR